MGPKSRRNSTAGSCTAAEYSSGGRIPTRIHSGSASQAGTNGSRLTPSPIAMSTRGPAMFTRGASAVARAITTTAMTTITSVSSTQPSIWPTGERYREEVTFNEDAKVGGAIVQQDSAGVVNPRSEARSGGKGGVITVS